MDEIFSASLIPPQYALQAVWSTIVAVKYPQIVYHKLYAGQSRIYMARVEPALAHAGIILGQLRIRSQPDITCYLNPLTTGAAYIRVFISTTF